MDIREEILQSISCKINGLVDSNIFHEIQNIIVVELNKYELQKRTTELSFTDNSSEGLLKRYIASKRIEGKANSTIKRYWEQNLKLIHFLQKPLFEVTTNDIRFYLAYKSQKDNISNRTLDGMRRCYNSFFSWLVSEGIISNNPCSALSQIKYMKQIKKPFSAVDLELIRKACKSARDIALVEFLYSTGCRVSEVSNLNILNVNMITGECTVIGKGNKERIVYLTEITILYLKIYLNGRKDNNPALFINNRKTRLTKNGIESLLHKIGEKAGVENVHPHRFRRTLATNLLDRGMNIQDVAMILGHADLKTTQIYCYISQNNVKNAYRKYCA